MLGRTAERIIRTRWKSIQELAEELYAIFSPDMPIEASKIIINQNSDDASPPFVINRPGDATGPSFQINRGGGSNDFGGIDIHGSNFGATEFNFTNDYGLPPTGSTLNLGDFPTSGGIGGVTGGGTGGGGGGAAGGGTDLSGIYFPGQEAGSVPSPQDNPIPLYGVIVSKVSGQTYTTNVWAKSPTGPRIGQIPVRFTMVDAGEEIPANTPVSVLAFPGLSGVTRVILDAVGYVPAFFGES